MKNLALVPPPQNIRPAARKVRDAGASFEEAAHAMGEALGRIGATLAAGASAMMKGFSEALADPAVLEWLDRLEFDQIAVRSRWRVLLDMLTLS